MKFKYEFECKNLTIGTKCSLTYIDTDFYGNCIERCGLGGDRMDCPLEEVKEDS